MEKSLQIVVVAIVILVTAVVVMIIFNSGTSEWMGVFNEWGRGSSAEAKCNQGCIKACAGSDSPNIGWSSVTQYAKLSDDEKKNGYSDCSKIMEHLPDGCKCTFASG